MTERISPSGFMDMSNLSPTFAWVGRSEVGIVFVSLVSRTNIPSSFVTLFSVPFTIMVVASSFLFIFFVGHGHRNMSLIQCFDLKQNKRKHIVFLHAGQEEYRGDFCGFDRVLWAKMCKHLRQVLRLLAHRKVFFWTEMCKHFGPVFQTGVHTI